MRIETRMTQRYGTPHAFAQAGMAFAGEGPELALAVDAGGGIGAIGVGPFLSPEALRATISLLRERSRYPFDINFITCFGNDAEVRVAAEERVPVVSFHWGHPPQHQIDLLKDAGTDLWVQVGSVEDARIAVSYGADAIIAQGWEAGGHNYGGLGVMALVPAILDAVADETLVLAAGGICDARGVAGALALGADGVWVGTRLLATPEARVHPEHHRRLIASQGADTLRSGVFGPETPEFNPMRLQNVDVTREWTDRLDEVPTQRDDLEIIGETVIAGEVHTKRRFDVMLPTADTTGDFEQMAWLMGQGVGLVHEVRPAEAVVREMMQGAAKRLAALSSARESTVEGVKPAGSAKPT